MGDTDNEHCDYFPHDAKNVKETHALGFLTSEGFFFFSVMLKDM